MKTCPDCAESVQDEAKVCRFCGHSFEGKPARGQKSDHLRVGCIIVLLLILFVILITASR